MDLIELAEDTYIWRALLNAVLKLLVFMKWWNFLTRCKAINFYRRILLYGVGSIFSSSNSITVGKYSSPRS